MINYYLLFQKVVGIVFKSSPVYAFCLHCDYLPFLGLNCSKMFWHTTWTLPTKKEFFILNEVFSCDKNIIAICKIGELDTACHSKLLGAIWLHLRLDERVSLVHIRL